MAREPIEYIIPEGEIEETLRLHDRLIHNNGEALPVYKFWQHVRTFLPDIDASKAWRLSVNVAEVKLVEFIKDN